MLGLFVECATGSPLSLEDPSLAGVEVRVVGAKQPPVREPPDHALTICVGDRQALVVGRPNLPLAWRTLYVKPRPLQHSPRLRLLMG